MFAIKVKTPPDDVKCRMRTRNQIYGSLGREQQIRVWRAVKEGRTLSDPQEAAAAVRLARRLLARRRRPLWRRVASSFTWIVALAYVALKLVLLLRREIGTVPSWPTVFLSFYLFTHVYLWRWWPRGESVTRAERLNLQVAESAGVQVEEGQVPRSDPGTPPGEPGPQV